MRRTTAWLVVLALAVLAGGVAWYRSQRATAGDATDLVRRAWTEGRRVALRGRQTVEMPNRGGKPVRVEAEVLASRDGQVRIRYLTPPLKDVVIWENGKRTYRYNPRLKRLTVATRRDVGEGAIADNGQLLRNYTARIVRREVIAGQQAIVVELRPKSQSDRWKSLSIDEKTGVVLASTERKGAGDALRSTRFTEIHYLAPSEEPPASDFKPSDELVRKYGTARPGDTSSRFTPETLSELIGFRVRLPKQLPRGYTFRGGYQTPCPCDNQHQAARLEYSDGLNVVTLIECGHPSHPEGSNCFRPEGLADVAGKNGAGITASTTRRIDGAEWHFLAVGDAPRSELEQMVQSAATP